LALTDPLTGCQNRRSFHEFANNEFERTQRYGNSTCIIAIDIDNFKEVNDTYGHASGDEVIKQLVKICLSGIRSSDHLGRLGGEEFAIILIETKISDATNVAEKIRKAFEEASIEIGTRHIGCTASFGVAQVLKTDNNILETLNRADTLMYQAKDAGRNQVITQKD